MSGFLQNKISGFPPDRRRSNVRRVFLSVCGIAAFFVLLSIVADIAPLQGALFQIIGGGIPPSGIAVSGNYTAQPNERGSIVVQVGESFPSFEGVELTIAVDAARAEILRIRRTAITQQYDISISFPASGIARVALVGAPRAVPAGAHLLELEMQLADHRINQAGSRIAIRLLGVRALDGGNRVVTNASDGAITIQTNQDTLTLPFIPSITDVDPGILALVRSGDLTIRGKALPSSPRVLLGNLVLPVRSASSTEITAHVLEDILPGVYAVSVESLLAEERVVVFGAPSTVGSVDILDALLFADPDTILYSPTNEEGEVVLWIPVYNPLGEDDAIAGSADLSAIGGNPNETFSGIGIPAVGPSGKRINWFRVPASGTIKLPKGLETNVDYPITIRVENRAGSVDAAVTLVSLRSQIPQGDAPSFGGHDTVPALPIPGGDVTFTVDVSDRDGVDSIALISLRLTTIGGGVQTLEPAFSLPSEPVLLTAPYTTDFTIPTNIVPGNYSLELRAVDMSGNETTEVISLTVVPPGGQHLGQPPEFTGRLEARPNAISPGGTVDFFAGVRDGDGTETIDQVSIDLVDIGGGIQEMTPVLIAGTIGTLPVVYGTSFDLPSKLANGTYRLPVRAVDANGLSAQTLISLTIDAALGGGGEGGSAPEFQGRLEVVPTPVGIGGAVKFFVSVRDIDGSDSLKKVLVDLVDVGGTEKELKPASEAVKGSIEPVLFTGEYKLPATVAPRVYNLAVRAFDAQGNAAKTVIPLTVSAIAPSKGVPVIRQAAPVPVQVPADGKTKVLFRVEVEDADGLNDIEIASINLTAIGGGIEKLSLQSQTTEALHSTGVKGATRGFFESRQVTIPTTVKSAGYDLPVTIEDGQGNRLQQNVRLTVGPALGGDAPVFRESRFVPETANPGGNVRLYVEVEDLNGAQDDSLTIVADFTEVRLNVEKLNNLIDFPSGTLVTRNTFASSTLTLPSDLPVGVYDVPLMVMDDTNNVVRTTARLRVERGGGSEGQEPRIAAEQTFQVPRVFQNTGKASGEIHVLVQDPDDDVLTVIAHLGSVASANSASVDSGNDIDLLCKSSSAIVCMERGALEDTGSRWFVLNGINVPETTLPSTDPYTIDITAIDEKGHTVEATIPLLVGGPETKEALTKVPAFDLIVPVSATQLELVVNSPVNAGVVDRSGKQFVIRPALDAFTSLAVRRVSWDTTGRYLYLETNPLTSNETYILSVVAANGTVTPLTDVRGNRFSSDTGGKITFTFAPSNEAPVIESVTVIDPTHIDVRFVNPVLPSSVHPDLLSAHSSLTSTISGNTKKILGGVLSDGGRLLQLTTESLQEGDRYRLRIAGVLAPGLIEAPAPGAEKTFIALFPKHDAAGKEGGMFPTADLNHDGRVDFADFTLFSAVYNTEYDRASATSTHSAASPSTGWENTAPQSTFGGNSPNTSFR